MIASPCPVDNSANANANAILNANLSMPSTPGDQTPPRPSPLAQRATQSLRSLNPVVLETGFAPNPAVNVTVSQPMFPNVGVGPTPMEFDEYLHTRGLLTHHTPHGVLAAVLVEVLDDNPTMAAYIRSKAERYMLPKPEMVMGGQLNPGVMQQGVPRRGRGPVDEVGYCSVHGNTARSMKHLTFNPMTNAMECVPGFHCLEGGATPPKKMTANAHPFMPQGLPPTPPAPAPTPAFAQGQLFSAQPSAMETEDISKLESILSTLRMSNAAGGVSPDQPVLGGEVKLGGDLFQF